MEKGDLLKNIAPYGLLCYTCTAAKDGVIQRHSQELLKYLENYDGFALQFSNYEPRFKNYPLFKDVLQMLSSAGCEGCRTGNCMYPGCPIHPCISQKGLAFCFECTAFPCGKVDSYRTLKANWLIANQRMKAVGLQAYFDEYKDRSHYT